MELHKLNSFDSWFDGYISVSSRIVKYFHNSKNFTIPEYEGRDELYEEYITKYDEYIRVLDVIYEESAYDVEPIFIKLKNVLHRLYEEGRLNPVHFIVENLSKISDLKHIGLKFWSDQMEEDKIYDFMLKYEKSYDNYVPFTSTTGLFGINTYLYLYFNKIYPVACSIKPYIVHGGIFEGSIKVMFHDFLHNEIIQNFRNLNEDKYDDYIEKLKIIYRRIFTDKLELGQQKLFLLILFISIHETPTFLKCYDKIEWYNTDMLYVYLKNGYYKPEDYGYNELDINEKNWDLTISYINNVLRDSLFDFCAQYREILETM